MITYEDIAELQKVKNLIEHFKEHQANQPNLAFFDLLKTHYGDDRNAEKQDKHNDKLPFQSQHCCNSSIAFYAHSSYPFQIRIFALEIKNKSIYIIEMPSGTSTSFWQPPKFSC